MNFKPLHLIQTKDQLLELVPSAIKEMNIVELTQALSTARKEQRILKESIMYRGRVYKDTATPEDIQHLELMTHLRDHLESEMYDKQGFVTPAITQKLVDTLIQKSRTYHRKKGAPSDY